MFEDAMTVGIRNILLMHVIILATSPESALRLRHALAKIWRTLNTPFITKRSDPAKKRFWEIDMTDFEP